MADPVLAFVPIVSFIAAMAMASYFKTLDQSLFRDAQVPLVAGVVGGIAIRFADVSPVARIVATGVVLTIIALYVRLTGRESEPADGMTLGALTGATAALPLALSGEGELLRLAECLLAGAVAGFGITFALTKITDKLQQAAIDALTAAVAVGAAYLPTLLQRSRIPEREIALGATALIPLLLIATVFKQWPQVRAELRHEASLGFIDDEDVRRTAHPILRLGRGGWHDAGAHREFVRIATRMALRKRQQRQRTEDVARLYQLEVIKLRMEMQEMARIDRAMRRDATQTAG
ncbi:MAG TPA: hypothetical protein VF111_14385 [Thermoanaerobaculia bacterium]